MPTSRSPRPPQSYSFPRPGLLRSCSCFSAMVRNLAFPGPTERNGVVYQRHWDAEDRIMAELQSPTDHGRGSTHGNPQYAVSEKRIFRWLSFPFFCLPPPLTSFLSRSLTLLQNIEAALNQCGIEHFAIIVVQDGRLREYTSKSLRASEKHIITPRVQQAFQQALYMTGDYNYQGRPPCSYGHTHTYRRHADSL